MLNRFKGEVDTRRRRQEARMIAFHRIRFYHDPKAVLTLLFLAVLLWGICNVTKLKVRNPTMIRGAWWTHHVH